MCGKRWLSGQSGASSYSDEADNFLAADQQRNFEIVSMLRTLMDDTNRRFKVVFAGLHNVQRYEGVPNQPFAHLPSLEIGPLDPLAARQPIVEPLEALGYRFGKNQAALLRHPWRIPTRIPV